MISDRLTRHWIDDYPVTEGDEVCPHRRPSCPIQRRITLALHRSNSGVGVGGLPEAGILPADAAPSVTR